jgi:hypothetical protein
MAPLHDTTEQERTNDRADRTTGWSAWLATPGAIRGGLALLVLLAIYVVGALSHLHVLGL